MHLTCLWYVCCSDIFLWNNSFARNHLWKLIKRTVPEWKCCISVIMSTSFEGCMQVCAYIFSHKDGVVCVCEREHVNLGLPTVCLCVIHHYMNTVFHASSIFILLWIIMIAYHLYTNQLSCYSLHILLSRGSCRRVVLTILASSVNAIPSSYLLINLDGWLVTKPTFFFSSFTSSADTCYLFSVHSVFI